jgi:hypothetical protein
LFVILFPFDLDPSLMTSFMLFGPDETEKLAVELSRLKAKLASKEMELDAKRQARKSLR